MNRENVFPLVFPEHVPGTLWVSPRLICAENLVPQCVYALGKQGFENQAVHVVRRGGTWAFDPDGFPIRVLCVEKKIQDFFLDFKKKICVLKKKSKTQNPNGKTFWVKGPSPPTANHVHGLIFKPLFPKCVYALWL